MNDDEIFDKFTTNNTAYYIKNAASHLVFYSGNPLNMFPERGAAATQVIRELVLNGPIAPVNIDTLVTKLLKHYHLEDWKPVVPYFREALALIVHLKTLVANIHPDFYNVVDKLIENSDEFETANDVYALSHEKVEALCEEIIEQ